MRTMRLFAVGCGLAAVLIGWWWYPKKDKFFPDEPLGAIRYYRGFGLTDKPSIAGKRYYRLDVVLTCPEDGRCEVDFRYGREKHPFIALYPYGTIRAKGYCTVVLDHFGQPIDIGQITDGVFYSPSGRITTEVRDGTGVETYWSYAGIKIWEAHLKGGHRTRLTMWHRNGQLQMLVPKYKDGLRHGPVRYYAADGSLRCIVIFDKGLEVQRIDFPPHNAQEQEGASARQ